MRSLFRWLSVCALLITLPVLAQDKAKDKAKEPEKPAESKEPAKDAPKEKTKEASKPATNVKKYNVVGSIAGKVTEVDTKEMTVEVEIRVRRGRDWHNEKKTYTIVDDAKIRAMKLPDRFDEKEKLVPYTAKEKYKAKGDNPKLPGYVAELSALTKGQMVEVELSLNKPVPGAAKKKKDAEPEEPFATMIVIAADEPKANEKKK